MERDRPAYGSFDASELYCPRCRTARPVRRHLLLVLPNGNSYEYRCNVCGESLGGKSDDDASLFHETLTRDLRD